MNWKKDQKKGCGYDWLDRYLGCSFTRVPVCLEIGEGKTLKGERICTVLDQEQ